MSRPTLTRLQVVPIDEGDGGVDPPDDRDPREPRIVHHDALFEQTFRDSPIGMVIADSDGTVLSVNHAFTRMSGRSAAALIGTQADGLIHPEDIDLARELTHQLATGDRSSFQVHQRFMHDSEDAVWTRSTVSRVIDRNGDARFVAQIEDVTEIRQAMDLLSRRTLHDPLTGLANGSLLLSRLAVSLEAHRTRATTVACLSLDIDHFALINDSFGYEAGDTLLVELARRIQLAVSPGDTVARLTEDEFVVVLDGVRDQEEAEARLAVVTAALQAPFFIQGHEVVSTASVGLALAEPDTTAQELMRNADTAMSRAKHHGHDRVEVFSEDLRESALERLSVEAELRAALREGEFVVHYQPIVDLATRETVALEALARWKHPTRGLLLPQHFIDVCEETNLIVPLGEFVLHEACRFIAARPDFHGRVLVNVSTKQIGVANLASAVRAALDATGVCASRLGLELTETGMMLPTQAARADLAALSDMGVDLIIDDFGTGYSALSSVLQNPVAGLKLAREFTMRLGDGSTGDRISTAMATLVDSLGIDGVIEGIETPTQYRHALHHGWPLGQGFLFGRPAAADAVDAALRAAPQVHAPVA